MVGYQISENDMANGERSPVTKEVNNDNLLILIDGHALVHRSFHAIQHPLTVSSTGEDVRGVYGFTNAFLRTLDEWNPTHVIITFDLPSPTFRHKMFDEYKAHRAPTPPELRGQFDRVRQLMSAFNVPIYELEGFEADDLLGTLSLQSQESGLDTLILTGDSDTLQLVSEKVRVLMSSSFQKRNLYNITAVQEKYGGLGPEYVAEIKALQGDASDNIPGVPGIGIKTAISLLTDYGSIEGIFENLESVKPPRAKASLETNKELAIKSRTLTTIVRDAPVSLDNEASKFGDFDRSNVVSLLTELEFHSIIPRIPGRSDELDSSGATESVNQLSLFGKETQPDGQYEIVTTPESLTQVLQAINTGYGFSFDTETNSLNPFDCNLVGISFSVEPGKAWYIPLGHSEGNQLQKQSVLEKLKPIFINETIPVRAHNANFDVSVMEQNGVKVNGLQFDTMIAAHVGGRRNYGLKELSLECFGFKMTPITELIGSGRGQITMAEVPIEKAGPYASADADYTERLYRLLKPELQQKEILDLFEQVEIPLIPVLIKIQTNGVSLNSHLLSDMSESLGQHLSEIRQDMFELIGHEFNLNSPKQLSDILFSNLKLPTTRKTKSGFSTDAQSLDDLKGLLDRGEATESDPRSYEVLNRILEHREVSKLKSTYVDALPEMVNPITKKIHTTYRQTGTTTGRLSSNDPNLQNIPVRTELGKKVREAFISGKNTRLLAADYSQIELRVLAHFSQDPGLIEAFNKGEDIHSATSALVYDIPLSEVTPAMRRIAKILNFGVIYGLSPHGITRQTNLTLKEGKQFIDIYFDKYKGIQEYLDSVKDQCRQLGYVETLLGRRRYLPDISARNFRLRSQAERAAINMPIQGTAADIIKVAMINIQNAIENNKMESAMILQVHDELIFDVPDEEMSEMESIVGELMPSSIQLSVPLTVETKIGNNWGNMK